eukprot:6359601-Prymnesium_polylepis.1
MAGRGREDATWRSATFGAIWRDGASTDGAQGVGEVAVAASAQRSMTHPGEHAQHPQSGWGTLPSC